MSEKAARKKPPNAGKGRVKGVPNKVTRDIRKGFHSLVEGSVDDLRAWLLRVAKRDPARALQIVANMAEFCVPKLSRTELSTGSDTLKVEIIDPTRRDSSTSK